MCTVSYCCCGCRLEAGCKLIAVLGLIEGGYRLVTGFAVEQPAKEEESQDTLSAIAAISSIIAYIAHVVACILLLWGAR